MCKYGFYTCAFKGDADFCSECDGGNNYEEGYYISAMDGIFKYIVAKYFFPKYAPNVKSWNKKLSGKNSNGNPVDFTDQDKKEIKKGLKQLFKDLQ